MTNLLTNANFSAGWTDVPVPGIGTINQEPDGWVLVWMEKGAYLESAGAFADFDHTPVITRATCIPECVHKLSLQLPESQRLGGSDALILAGDAVYKVFSNYGSYSADLYQHVDHLTPGATVRLTAPLRPHYNPFPGGDGSPGACAALVWIEGADGCRIAQSEWLSFEHGVADRQWATIELSATVPTYGGLLIGATFESRSEAGIDWFTDAWRLEYVDEPEPEPEPGECPRPRAGWTDRTTVLVRADAPDSVWLAACAWANEPTRKHSVDKSWDHAFWGPGLDSVIIKLWMDKAGAFNVEQVLDWGEQYYPNVAWSVMCVGPASGAVDPEPEPEPEPGEEPQYTLPSRNLIGLHSGFMRARSLPYLVEARPTIQKWFAAGDCWQAHQSNPDVLNVWRKYVGNEEGRINEKPTIRESAVWYLDQYSAEIASASAALGITEAALLATIGALESLNETIPTFNPDQLKRSVEFDVCFAEETARRYGNAVGAVLLCGAVGNPHETEVPLLLPAAKAAVKYGGFLGYHSYWMQDETTSYLAPKWVWHAGRWMAWDIYFRSQGVYPRYASGEGGICYARGGVSFDSGLGWKACGGFLTYLEALDLFNTTALAWNAEHGNRFYGLTIFGYGNWGWDSFELGDGEVNLLIDWARGL